MKNITKYLNDMFGLDAIITDNVYTGHIPNYLNDRYFFYEINMINETFIIIYAKSTDISPTQISADIAKLSKILQRSVVYSADAIDSYALKKLTSGHTPFIIPNKQFFVPQLGIVLKKMYERTADKRAAQLSPVSQCVIIYILLSGNTKNQTITNISSHIKYTIMSVSRAFRELSDLEIVSIKRVGREKVLEIDSLLEVWEKSKDYLFSPVEDTIQLVDDDIDNTKYIISGTYALSEYSNLSDNQITYALSAKEFTELIEDNYPEPYQDRQNNVYEQWRYNPNFIKGAHPQYADKISIYLSLRNSNDPRVKIALREMMEEFKWFTE